jgi:hypothetical protein
MKIGIMLRPYGAQRKLDEVGHAFKIGCCHLLEGRISCIAKIHRQHSKPIERKLLCIFPVFLETHPPQAARGRCGFIKIKIAETYAKI